MEQDCCDVNVFKINISSSISTRYFWMHLYFHADLAESAASSLQSGFLSLNVGAKMEILPSALGFYHKSAW